MSQSWLQRIKIVGTPAGSLQEDDGMSKTSAAGTIRDSEPRAAVDGHRDVPALAPMLSRQAELCNAGEGLSAAYLSWALWSRETRSIGRQGGSTEQAGIPLGCLLVARCGELSRNEAAAKHRACDQPANEAEPRIEEDRGRTGVGNG